MLQKDACNVYDIFKGNKTSRALLHVLWEGKIFEAKG